MSSETRKHLFSHSGSLGDIIYALPVLKYYGSSELYLTKKDHFTFLASLIRLQPYILSVHYGSGFGREVINLDRFRSFALSAISNGIVEHLILSHFRVVNIDYIPNPNEPWIYVDSSGSESFPIIINRTLRYNSWLPWSVLSDYTKYIGFIGSGHEYRRFVELFNVRPTYIPTTSALEIARLINQSRLFIGNQSFCYAVAEGLKKKRILEACLDFPNCMPIDSSAKIDLTPDDLYNAINKNKY